MVWVGLKNTVYREGDKKIIEIMSFSKKLMFREQPFSAIIPHGESAVHFNGCIWCRSIPLKNCHVKNDTERVWILNSIWEQVVSKCIFPAQMHVSVSAVTTHWCCLLVWEEGFCWFNDSLLWVRPEFLFLRFCKALRFFSSSFCLHCEPVAHFRRWSTKSCTTKSSGSSEQA